MLECLNIKRTIAAAVLTLAYNAQARIIEIEKKKGSIAFKGGF